MALCYKNWWYIHSALCTFEEKRNKYSRKAKEQKKLFSLNSTKKTTSWAQSCQHNILEKGNRAEEEFEDGAFHCFMTGPMGLTDLKIKMPVHCSGINKRHLSGLSKQSFTIKLNTTFYTKFNCRNITKRNTEKLSIYITYNFSSLLKNQTKHKTLADNIKAN